MKRFLMSAAAVVAVLGLSSSVWAGGKPGGNGGNHGHSNGIGNFHNNNFKPQVLNNHGPQNFGSQKFISQNKGFANYHLTNGVKSSFGICYKGNNHCQWSSQCYNPRYCCTTYYCPYACCWYYWCATDCCYYPVTYCPYGVYR